MKVFRGIVFFLVWFFGGNLCPYTLALQPEEIAVIANSTSDDSREIAEYYCQRRKVPPSNIIALALPDKESISRREYQEKIAPLIKERLLQPDMKDRIKCLLTVTGVPLKISPFVPTGPSAQNLKLVVNLLNKSFDQLQQTTEELKNLVDTSRREDPNNEIKDKKFYLPYNLRDRQKKAEEIFRAAAEAVQLAQNSLDAAPSSQYGQQNKIQQFNELTLRLWGLDGRIRILRQKIEQTFTPEIKKQWEDQLNTDQAQLQQLGESIAQISQGAPDVNDLEKRYQLINQAVGLQGLCHMLLKDRLSFDDDDSAAAFDSELALILWDSYRLSLWQPNPLCVYNEPQQAYANCPWTTLMVSRLDGPDKEIVKGLVDKAITAETMVLRGSAYFDARGIHQEIDTFGSYGNFDESLRKTVDMLKKNTALNVVLDDNKTLFGPGQCPDTIIYCGWYSLRNYIDSFQFQVGAVGYHIASFEAETLRKGNPDSNIWCKRMLENHITATLGAVEEPYLPAIPQPERFFAELISDKYTLVECFFRANPFNSWRMILIGDPLYHPHYAQNRGGFKPRW